MRPFTEALSSFARLVSLGAHNFKSMSSLTDGHSQMPLFLLFASEIRGMVEGVDLDSSVAATNIAAALPGEKIGGL